MDVGNNQPMDKATFYRWLERQERRHELVNGTPQMLEIDTSNHSRIKTNAVAILASGLDRDRFDVTAGDYAIETGDRSVRFADIMVMPFEPRPDARNTDLAQLLVEVLSETTAHVDFGEKLNEYRALDGVGHYLVIAQDRVCIWSWHRDEAGAWSGEPDVINEIGGQVEVRALGLTLPVSDIYRRVTLPS